MPLVGAPNGNRGPTLLEQPSDMLLFFQLNNRLLTHTAQAVQEIVSAYELA
jgi:hypothetical protein